MSRLRHSHHAPATTSVEAGATTADARLNAWFERKYEEQLQFSPIQLTMLGRKDLYAKLDDMSREGAAQQLAWQVAAVEEMKSSFDYDALGDDAKLSWDLFVYQMEAAQGRRPFQRPPLSVRADGRRAVVPADVPDQLPQGRRPKPTTPPTSRACAKCRARSGS